MLLPFLERIFKEKRKWPAGAPGGKGGEWMPGKGGRIDTGASGIAGSGRGFAQDAKGIWRNKAGQPASAAIVARMKALRVPPGWKDVRLNQNAESAMQVRGVDKKGRPTKLYSAEFTAHQDAQKFARNRAFNEVVPTIQRHFEKDRGHSDAALVLSLIHRTGFRPGSERDTGADKQAFGATTLRSHHVKISGSTLTFKFTGKKGVAITHVLPDAADLAKHIAPRLKRAGKLFDTSERELRSYMDAHGGKGFKVKDFRTWNGTRLAIESLKSQKAPRSLTEFKKLQKAIATKVSSHLGNTPAMALKAYIDPAVWHPFHPQVHTSAQRHKKSAEIAKMTGLYLCRRVLNADELTKWCEAVGIPGAKDFYYQKGLHCTTAYSKEPFDAVLGTGTIVIRSALFQGIGPLGDKGALVLYFDAPAIEKAMRQHVEVEGAQWDYAQYIPHITLTCNKHFDGSGLKGQVPDFSILLGPEEAQPLKGAEYGS